MPKKRKAGGKKKKSGGRRVGRSGDTAIPTALGVAAGVVASRFATTFAKKQWPKANTTLIASAPAILGALVVLDPLNMKILKDPIVKGIGMGLVGGGVTNVLVDMGVVGAPPRQFMRRVAAPGNSQKVPLVGMANRGYADAAVPNAAGPAFQPANPGMSRLVPTVGAARRRRHGSMY